MYEIRFAYIFKISHNDRSFPLSPLTWFKLQCWGLAFTWINQFKLICFSRYFWKTSLKEKGIFSNSEIREKKSRASSRKWVHLQEETKEPLSKNVFLYIPFPLYGHSSEYSILLISKSMKIKII